MTDIELLELAAKAAGMELTGRFGDGFRARTGNQGSFEWWNPLTDDGGAFRLAVKLGIGVESEYKDEFGVSKSYASIPKGGIFEEDHDADKYEATRRAIVRAAAEIGKTTP